MVATNHVNMLNNSNNIIVFFLPKWSLKNPVEKVPSGVAKAETLPEKILN